MEHPSPYISLTTTTTITNIISNAVKIRPSNTLTAGKAGVFRCSESYYASQEQGDYPVTYYLSRSKTTVCLQSSASGYECNKKMKYGYKSASVRTDLVHCRKQIKVTQRTLSASVFLSSAVDPSHQVGSI